ncbi:uncharacterized protein LOC127283730 isoform X4 [Leptopilina boulardi]|uniref:uncharacterized protein LOC127283730 isoform X4 n=1 Tax=Leptopilina boulardi TaxID=63433 RepID=UPI0021F66EFE|nr:uncharacterized protein LOC127283730 isoform X4 [Leptopilina boulardi]
MFLNQSTKTSRSFGIFSIPYFLLMIFLIKECSSRIICHSSSNLEAGQKYEISYLGYQDLDFDDSRCTYDLTAPNNKKVQVNCSLNLQTAKCVTQAVEVYKSFNNTVSFPDQYCESTSFTTVSIGRQMRIVHRREHKNLKGIFTCHIEVV